MDLIDKARETAYLDSKNQAKIKDALPEMKSHLKKLQKTRLRIVERYLCDKCDVRIDKPTDGFVVWGNIYNADPQNAKGLIGEHFPLKKLTSPDQVKKTVLCKECFFISLGLTPESTV